METAPRMPMGKLHDFLLHAALVSPVFVWGSPGLGKALTLDTPLPTPQGWTTMGKISVGEEIFDECGEIATVKATTPVFLNRDVFRITFDDGSTIDADGEHLWTITTKKDKVSGGADYVHGRRSDKRFYLGYDTETKAATWAAGQQYDTEYGGMPITITTAEISKRIAAGKDLGMAVECPQPLKLPDKELLVDPYLLGLWLGGSSTGSRITPDQKIEDIAIQAGYTLGKRYTKPGGSSWICSVKRLSSQLRTLGIFNDKFIPDDYLRSSEFQRRALVEGLMDSDGHNNKSEKVCEFTTTKPLLANGFHELLASLGIKHGVTTASKQLRWQISSVVPIASLPVRCIQTTAPSGLYLAGDSMIPTHNSAVIEQFAEEIGMDCVSLLGSQLAPEDLIGVPRIEGAYSVFCPPKQIAREQPYVLFLDELNACSPDVQKAFYSLIHDRRLGEYHLPEGSIVVGAGNRASDNAIVRPMSSALINRMVHVQVTADSDAWLAWAASSGIHPLVYEYIREHPRQLWRKPPKEERCFSTPRSWTLLASLLSQYTDDELHKNNALLAILAESVVSPEDAKIFATWSKNREQRYLLNHILKGERGWPEDAKERDLLHYLTLQFRDQLIKTLPSSPDALAKANKELSSRALVLLRSLADLAPELAQTVIITDEEGRGLPDWFMIEVGDSLPHIINTRHAKKT